MKKIFSVIIAVVLMASVFTVGASAAYTPKTVELVAYSDGTCEVPEGVTIYVGDTIIIPRSDLLYTGDFKNEKTGLVEEDLTVMAKNVMILRNGTEIAKTWGYSNDNSFTFSDGETRQPTKSAYYAKGQSLEVPGKYQLKVSTFKSSTTSESYVGDATQQIVICTIDLRDAAEAPEEEPSSAAPSEEPSSEAPSEEPSSEEPSVEASSEETSSEAVSSEATSSAVTSSKATSSASNSSKAPASTTPGSNNTWIWIVVAVVVVAVIVVIVVVASKKKKK